VKKIVPKMLLGKCDRVVMPLPKGGEAFLKEALLALKPEGGIIHFYRFVERSEGAKQAIAEVKEAAKGLGFKAKILGKKKVRSFSPKIEQVVVDFFAKKKK